MKNVNTITRGGGTIARTLEPSPIERRRMAGAEEAEAKALQRRARTTGRSDLWKMGEPMRDAERRFTMERAGLDRLKKTLRELEDKARKAEDAALEADALFSIGEVKERARSEARERAEKAREAAEAARREVRRAEVTTPILGKRMDASRLSLAIEYDAVRRPRLAEIRDALLQLAEKCEAFQQLEDDFFAGAPGLRLSHATGNAGKDAAETLRRMAGGLGRFTFMHTNGNGKAK